MNNPWKDISLSDYENHMALDSVQQLQAMNQIMKGQLNQYEVQSAMILGIAGGNGLEHVDTEKLNKVYGVDINQEYLTITKKRYENLSDTLDCLCIDLVSEAEKLPQVSSLTRLVSGMKNTDSHGTICTKKCYKIFFCVLTGLKNV